MNTKVTKNLTSAAAFSLAMTLSIPASAQDQGGFFAAIAKNTEQRMEHAANNTEQRLVIAGDAVARHLEHRPEDLRHVDDIAKLVVQDTAGSVEHNARVVVGGVIGDSIRSAFGAFRGTQD